MWRALIKKVISASVASEAPEVIMGIITSCMEPAKMKNAEAKENSTPYPASTVRTPKAMPMNR